MRPTANVLNYSVKNVRNDVWQKTMIYIWKIAIELSSVGLAHAWPNDVNSEALYMYAYMRVGVSHISKAH